MRMSLTNSAQTSKQCKPAYKQQIKTKGENKERKQAATVEQGNRRGKKKKKKGKRRERPSEFRQKWNKCKLYPYLWKGTPTKPDTLSFILSVTLRKFFFFFFSWGKIPTNNTEQLICILCTYAILSDPLVRRGRWVERDGFVWEFRAHFYWSITLFRHENTITTFRRVR